MLLALLITALNFSSGELMKHFQFSSTFLFYQNMVLGSVVLRNAQVVTNLYRKAGHRHRIQPSVAVCGQELQG